MKLKLIPPLPKVISRLRENCFKICVLRVCVQSFVKIRIFELSEFPCYKLIFEYFHEPSYVYTIYMIISILYFDIELFFVIVYILFYFQLLS